MAGEVEGSDVGVALRKTPEMFKLVPSNDPFKIGDAVRLNSGGPVMTIEEVTSKGQTGKVRAIWFVMGRLEREIFPVLTLGIYKEPARQTKLQKLKEELEGAANG